MTHDVFSGGLFSFFSSQADLLLSQYENINQLLGPTNDWTHPGTHCEILLRNFLRTYLLKGMSVDKGFVFGRVERHGKDRHGPEIDILIHDTTHFRPILRVEDFVIVQPDAVLGMIQVKRTFTNEALAKGIEQIVFAKQHLLDVLLDNKIRTMTAHYGGDDTRVKKYPQLADRREVFTAVVGFDDRTNKSSTVYRDILFNAYQLNRSNDYPGAEYDTSLYALPDVVSSLKHVSLCAAFRNIFKREYYRYESLFNGKNVAIQLLLSELTKTVFPFGSPTPPFAFPESIQYKDIIQVPPPVDVVS